MKILYENILKTISKSYSSITLSPKKEHFPNQNFPSGFNAIK